MANLRSLAVRAARAEGIPVPLFLRLIQVESGFRPEIVSSAGAIGLTQLMPGTARGLGVDPHNPAQNLQGGARYLRAMFERFGSWPLALAAYNAGAGAVEEHNGIPPFPQTQHYVQMIMGGLRLPQTAARAPRMPNLPPMVSTSTLDVQQPQGPDFGALGMENLSTDASPMASLHNLVDSVHAGEQNVVAEMAAKNQAAGGMPAIPMTAGGGGAGAPGIAQVAARYIGTPYVWGGSSPAGFDCSGLLQWSAAKAGIHIGRTTYQQWQEGRAVGLNQLQAGDAVFFRGSDSRGGLPGHVGIYIGHGEFIEAPHTGATVRISRLAGYPGYMGARRY